MTERVYLHVGAPKSGTTYLQNVLATNRELLAAAGVLVVGETQLDRIHAAMVIREDTRLEQLPPRAASAWTRLLEQVQEWPGATAILSYELLAGAAPAQARRALADLAQFEVHVVVTARDLATAVPSAWQERLKFAATTPLERWMPEPASAGPRSEWGWRTMDPSGIAARWGATLPPDRVHVVTVPRHGVDPEELWHRFAEATRLDDVAGLDLHPARSNESLGVVPAELLRRVNERIRDRLAGNREHALWLRDLLAHGVLAGLGRERIGLTDAQFEDARARSSEAIEALTSAGYSVHGELQDIAATRPDARTPGQATDPELLETAIQAVVELVLLLRRRTEERDAAVEDLARVEQVSARGFGRRVLWSASAVALRRDAARLEERVEALSAELQKQRRLQLRVAELTDLVSELLVPSAEQDERLTAPRLRQYRQAVL